MRVYGISFTKDADDDLKQIYSYYEEIEVGLGDSFFKVFNDALNRLSFNPTGFKKIYKNFRVLIVRKFRYKILFEFDDNKIIIAGIFHQMRNPKLMLKRLR